jgi:hypothetical protein
MGLGGLDACGCFASIDFWESGVGVRSILPFVIVALTCTLHPWAIYSAHPSCLRRSRRKSNILIEQCSVSSTLLNNT